MIAPVQKLVRQIREALANGGTNAPLESLASEYSRLCVEASQHLESCAIMIAKGSDYQALQLAETEPALLDMIAALSFAEAPEWAEFCAAQRLPVAPKFDPRAVQSLDAVYAKGIAANHPMYKDYRAAVTSRNDAKALQIVRSIVRLNPGDANAASELARWENKFFQLRLQDLRGALARGDRHAAVNDLGELERLAPEEKLAELPEAIQATEFRRRDDREAAIALSERLVPSLEEERKAGSWRMVGDILARLNALQEEHGFRLPAASAAVCAKMKEYYDEERARASEIAEFQKAAARAGALAADIDTRLRSRAAMTLPRARAALLDLNQRWDNVESYRQPIDEELSQRVAGAVHALRAEVGRREWKQRAGQCAAGVVALAILGSTAWWALSAWRARDYEKQLTALQASGQVEAVEKMSEYLRTEQPGLAARPVLRAKMDALGKWTRDERMNLKEVETILTDLERMRSAGFETFDPTLVANEIATDTKLAAELPAGLHATPESRLAVVRGEFETYLNGAREKLSARNDEELTSLESMAGTQLTYDQSKEAIASGLEKIAPGLKGLEALADPPLKALELPEPLKARVEALRKRYDLFQGEIAALKTVKDALVQAASLETYHDALAGFTRSHLSQVSEVSRARKLLAVFPKPDELMAALVAPGDSTAFMAAKVDMSGPSLMPDSVFPAEIGKLLALREDPYLSNIWDVTLIDYQHKSERREVYSRGDVRKDGPREVGDGLLTTTWAGAVYDPAQKSENIQFAPINFTSTRSGGGTSGTGEIAASQLGVVSQALARLELNRMTDAAGEKYEKPLLGVFDSLVRIHDTNPVFKAFMMQQLAGVMSYRPYMWGAEFCPSLKADLDKLKQICGGSSLRSEDWMLDRKRAELNPVLTPFFRELESRGYLAEARINRDLVHAAIKAGIHYAGFIDEASQPHLLGEANAGSPLWALSAADMHVERFHPPGNGEKAPEKFASFSPVFFVPLESQTLELASKRTPGLKTTSIPLFQP